MYFFLDFLVLICNIFIETCAYVLLLSTNSTATTTAATTTAATTTAATTTATLALKTSKQLSNTHLQGISGNHFQQQLWIIWEIIFGSIFGNNFGDQLRGLWRAALGELRGFWGADFGNSFGEQLSGATVGRNYARSSFRWCLLGTIFRVPLWQTTLGISF